LIASDQRIESSLCGDAVQYPVRSAVLSEAVIELTEVHHLNCVIDGAHGEPRRIRESLIEEKLDPTPRRIRELMTSKVTFEEIRVVYGFDSQPWVELDYLRSRVPVSPEARESMRSALLFERCMDRPPSPTGK